MKIRKQIIVMVIIFLLIVLLVPTISKAYMEIKDGGIKWVNIPVSAAFDECKKLNDANSALGSDELDAHLVLNRDWGAVAYLTMSDYGVGDASKGKSSTTGNNSGVKDFGATLTWTAGVHETGLESTFYASEFRQSLIDNKESKYVELLKNDRAANPKGLALNEMGASGGYCTEHYAMLVRNGVLGFGVNSSDWMRIWRRNG